MFSIRYEAPTIPPCFQFSICGTATTLARLPPSRVDVTNLIYVVESAEFMPKWDRMTGRVCDDSRVAVPSVPSSFVKGPVREPSHVDRERRQEKPRLMRRPSGRKAGHAFDPG